MNTNCFSAVIAALLALHAVPGAAQQEAVPPPAPSAPTGPSYADLMDLAATSPIAVIVEIEDQAALRPERAIGINPGQVRLYLETKVETLLAGPGVLGESLAFLVDRDLTDRGKVPKLKKQRFLVFARPVPGRPGELQLTGPDALLPASPDIVDRARGVLRQYADGDLPEITGIHEAMSVAGNLARESESQLFLETVNGAPVSLSVLRRPGMAPEWGVSWSEIVDQAATAPRPETLEWYKLACFLPGQIPDGAFLQDDADARIRAREDYAFILDDLGPCGRREG